MRLGFELDASLVSNAAVGRNSEVVLELGYDGHYAQMGKFLVDNISSPKEAVDDSVMILCRSESTL